MQEHKLFQIFTEKFDKLKSPYMVTGSVASIVYGEPRLTHDIDIVVTIPLPLIEKFQQLFPADEFYCPPIEVLKNEVIRENRGHCNIIHHTSGFKADIYFAGKDNFQHWALENIRVIDFLGEAMPIAPVEYVIIKKLEFYKEGKAQKHINDIISILENSKEIINFDLLNKFLAQFGLAEEWKLCS
ncbi:MAG: hypothetical protein K8H86_09115 [Ignavibacteriaceae bacterium]|nr:hypothetical protein [Ignavibacteriaceae bacterium]